MRTTYLADLSNEAVAKGIDVPIFTCWTNCVRGATDPSAVRAFDSCNLFVSYGVDGTARSIAVTRFTRRFAITVSPNSSSHLQSGLTS